MLVLALDTATPAITAGVVELERTRLTVLGERVTLNPRAHGELLTPQMLQAAGQAGIRLPELDAVVCGNGPGPYTGLRAGLATAAALAHGLGIPAYPVCTLDAIAAETTTTEPFLVVTDARRREVYWAGYDEAGRRTDGPRVQRPAEVSSAIRLAAGNGAQLYADAAEPGAVRVIPPAQPSPRGLVTAAREELLASAAPAPLTPLYLRRPDAAEPGARKRVSTP
ncbi:tRNA (adenosine(37)-N6)-threonylcarbamoyltransferase complex dimerization subunit type 1 TsaB [Amycolatopsis cihanbeyliensis]|uniref:tRNA threonylcarbamoyl adenosine modification protein YeaZ n=1 Tax=Amycolatopsis cihanbeyliensis TaxID=1128664 RepID=A0A542DJ44_AMYCI|nr:tRNA (adenosine(37)-N6)-threonylcarbamoyltransferase complex dimerization subunit type 1 TsaB [Amycolatopsis cihanbeyliensis]TQJ03121.1 tRNA threonylcarbamoyl adenosine modification protein YeaZ [Amycolatopsis cihanbeyliensis]